MVKIVVFRFCQTLRIIPKHIVRKIDVLKTHFIVLFCMSFAFISRQVLASKTQIMCVLNASLESFLTQSGLCLY